MGNTLYFEANDTRGAELWRSDGTSVSIVQDIVLGPNSSGPTGLTAFGNFVYFTTFYSDPELWRSDGTTVTKVADINPGPDGSNISGFVPLGDTLYFLADNGSAGTELWQTDGTNTTLAKDILPGSDGSDIRDATAFGNSIYLGADDGVHGDEVWRVAPDPPPDTAADLQIDGKKLKVSRKGTARLKLTCPATEANPPCSGSLALATAKKVSFKGKRRKVKLDQAKFSLGGGETAKLKLKLSGAEVDLLADVAKARKLKAAANVADAAGNTNIVTKGLKAVLAK